MNPWHNKTNSFACWLKVRFLSAQLFVLFVLDFLGRTAEDLDYLLQLKVRPSDTGYLCLVCNTMIKLKKHVRRHMRELHMVPQRYLCPPCNKVFENRAFSKHIAAAHPEWKGSLEYGKFRLSDDQ